MSERDTPSTAVTASLPPLRQPAVIVMIGLAGSGKSTWARQVFPHLRVLSSDDMRETLTDDATHHGCSKDAFRMLRELATLRLRYGRPVVVDATNLQNYARQPWLELAANQDVPAIAVWLDVDAEVAIARQHARERKVPSKAIRRQAENLEGLHDALLKERWSGIYRLQPNDSDGWRIDAIRPWTPPEREPVGAGGVRLRWRDVDVIGDVHGCVEELRALLEALGWRRDDTGWHHPEGRHLVFAGDLVDRGPASLRVLDLASELVEGGHALLVLGNHDDKWWRVLRGNNVKVQHGLETTLAEWDALDEAAQARARARHTALFESAVYWALFDPDPERPHDFLNERLVVAHAAWKPSVMRANLKHNRYFCLYGPTTGRTDASRDNLPERLDWTLQYPADAPHCVHGHTAFMGPVVSRNNTRCIDLSLIHISEPTRPY